MAVINGKLKRVKGKDVSTDQLSLSLRGRKWIAYEITSDTANEFRGILVMDKSKVSDWGDPDGKQITVANA